MTSIAQQAAAKLLPCDGCGWPSTPQHIAARIERLQWVTRFRPIHIQVLFVAEAPQRGAHQVPPIPAGSKAEGEQDAVSFPPSAIQDYAALLGGLAISRLSAQAAPHESEETNFLVRLAEFQRRGFYLAFLTECPLQSSAAGHGREASRPDSAELCVRLGPTLVKRIQYSYRPKQIVLLSAGLRPLIPMLEQAGLGKSLLLDNGDPFELPRAGGPSARDFQAAWERAQAGGSAATPSGI